MIVVGIDEVGRGCWAGPLLAAAVILDKPISGLRDSKKISKIQRQNLAELIHQQARAIGIGWVWPTEIDQYGLTYAVRTAMTLALDQITADYDEVIIDGNINYLLNIPKTKAVIKADDTVAAVSAASIVAKVARDNYMADIAQQYPNYGFEKHVGYGTAHHLAQIQKHGITIEHRLSFKPIKQITQSQV